MVELAEHLLGPGCVIRAHAMKMRRDAELFSTPAGARILVRVRLPVERARFAVAHEVAEWHLRRVGYSGDDIESIVRRIAAALVAPRPIALRVARHSSVFDDPGAPSEAMQTTQTLAALREGEVTGESIAVVGPGFLEARGAELVWPDREAVRRFVKEGGPGLRKVDLDRRRVALSIG